jgi:hypothetical protein
MDISFNIDRLITDEEDLKDLEFKGTILIAMPAYEVRMRLPIEMGLGDMADMKKDASTREKLSGIEMIAKGAAVIKPFLKSCDLKNDAGLQILTIDDMYGHPGCDPIVHGLIMAFMQGFPAKKKKPNSVSSPEPVSGE